MHPQTEDYNVNVDPTGPGAVYDDASGRRYADGRLPCGLYDLSTGIRVRIFNTYGPRLRPSTVASGRTFSCRPSTALPLTCTAPGTSPVRSLPLRRGVGGARTVRIPESRRSREHGNPSEITMLELIASVL